MRPGRSYRGMQSAGSGAGARTLPPTPGVGEEYGSREPAMRAARITAYGPIDTLRVEEVDDPVVGPGEVLVDIAAAAVNYPDLLIMSGGYQVRWPLPLIPGSEFAGTDRKSTRLNSSHVKISYAVFCLKKKKQKQKNKESKHK